jgi:signal transduction histidine kinase
VRRLVGDGALAAFVGSLAQVMVWRGEVAGARVPTALLFLLIGWPLILRRRLPLVPVTAFAVAIAAQALATANAAEGSGLLLAGCASFYAVAAYGSRPTAVAGLLVGGAALVISLAEDRHFRTPEELWSGAFWVLFVLAFWLAGIGIHARRESSRARVLTAKLERERNQVVADERARIARELHDVIAHHVSVVVLQAVAAQGLLRDAPERAREPLTRIEQSGREALGELRRLLAVLRPADGTSPRTPEPGVDDLPTLVEKVRATGLAVDLNVIGQPRAVSRGLQLTCYRVVQECLTNVLKHAQASHAHVELRYRRDALDVEISDDGHGAEPGVGGFGLLGMRERVAVYGGKLEVVPATAAGFTVRVRLPFDEATQ